MPGAPDQALQDCSPGGRLQAEAVATAPLPKPALRLCVWCAPDQALQDCPTSGRLHAEAVAMAPRPQRRSRSLDALKRCNDDPHIIAAVAQLFWNDRKVFFGIVLALRPAAPFPVWLTPACMVRAPRPRRPPNVLGFLGFMDDRAQALQRRPAHHRRRRAAILERTQGVFWHRPRPPPCCLHCVAHPGVHGARPAPCVFLW